MRYTAEDRFRVIREVYRDNGYSFRFYGMKKHIGAVSKDLGISRSVISLWINNYLREQSKCYGREQKHEEWLKELNKNPK